MPGIIKSCRMTVGLNCSAAAIASVLLSGALYLGWPSLPFMDRVGLVFVACFGVAIVLSLLEAPRQSALRVDLKQVDYSTNMGFNVAALVITAILVGLYTVWW
jgi:SSS family solute:Na+ symporter